MARLEEQAAAPDFWDDPEAAQQVMQRLADLRDEREPWVALEQRVADAVELAALGDEHLIEKLQHVAE
ncbi:MAG: PCRF domain-containing protein [Anaerolineae bacterium]